MSNIDDIMDFENGDLSEEAEVKMFQKLISSGTVWGLQGSYGRQAMQLLRDGKCELGEQQFKDAYGNVVPSKYDVKPGTTGAPLETRKNDR
jgi:hypothetical protein